MLLFHSLIGSGYKGHTDVLAASVKKLTELENKAQSSYINLYYNRPFLAR